MPKKTTTRRKTKPKGKRKLPSKHPNTNKKTKKKKGADHQLASNTPTKDKRPAGFQKGNRWAFKKGKSGNPKGRPKGSGLTDTMRRYFHLRADKFSMAKKKALKLGLDPKQYSVAEVLIASAIAEAIKGKDRHTKYLWERDEGAIKQHIGISGDPVKDYIDEMTGSTQPEDPGT